MARVNVFLGDDLLEAVDGEAAQAKTNRSALIQAALTAYLDTRRKAREEAEAQRRIDEACGRLDALAERLGDWDPVSIIRQFRDSRPAPLRVRGRRPSTKRARKRA